MTKAEVSNKDWFAQLDAGLAEHEWLWRPQPYKQARPAWCETLQELTTALLGLSDTQLAALSDDGTALMSWLGDFVPSFIPMATLCALQARDTVALSALSPHLAWDVPGRKWTQIAAFAEAVGPVVNPMVEWCGGKGHLGRLLAVQWALPVVTLEFNEALCQAGQRLAQRARVTQSFHVADVLVPATQAYLAGSHALALHACGELHRTLIRAAAEAGAVALDVVPCCYHLGMGECYQAFSPSTMPVLTRDDLRLAVTETVTSSPREVRQRDKEMAWKLGYDLVRRIVSGEDVYQSVKPIDKPWLNLGFEAFCRQLAQRDSVELPADMDWMQFETLGWARQRETMRLSLVRKAFRRPLEVWLVLDLANFLTDQGFRVSIGTFCQHQITPRNILLSARR